jgi:hypothetical protein
VLGQLLGLLPLSALAVVPRTRLGRARDEHEDAQPNEAQGEAQHRPEHRAATSGADAVTGKAEYGGDGQRCDDGSVDDGFLPGGRAQGMSARASWL